ncbi:MAG: protein-L-isoaspartate(D-aspartate) O-methyltransferase [Solirubrobacteraceae bacterium]
MDEALALARRLRPAVDNERVLAAIASVPRERFIGDEHHGRAYENVALPIAGGQTISQPIVVARMLELLELDGDERVLDVGTGSGYHAALLARLAREVISIERLPELSAAAAVTLTRLGYANVTCVVADGCAGFPQAAPFDAINVAAATGAEVPVGLVDQLAIGGRLVAPVGNQEQHLTRLLRTPDGVTQETLEAVRFVPLVRG